MSILDTLKVFYRKRRQAGITDFHLETIRFRKLLENARALLDLFEDGHEKMAGEYILDSHYVTSLVESVAERLGMMAYDACVLVPEAGSTLYSKYDQLRSRAEEMVGLFESSGWRAASTGGVDDAASPDDLEYQMLSEALQWMDGESSGAGSTVMDFMRQTFDLVIGEQSERDGGRSEAVLSRASSARRGSPVHVIELWRDPQEGPVPLRSLTDISCHPLRLMLLEASSNGSPTARGTRPDGPVWIAAVSDDQLSLLAFRGGLRFRLETTASGSRTSDFIFVFADGSIPVESILPGGFHVDRTGSGRLAWLVRASPKTVEDSLIAIGRSLLSDPAKWIGERPSRPGRKGKDGKKEA
jgi:hypothetical protein